MRATSEVFMHADSLDTIKIDVNDGAVHVTVLVEKWALLKALRDDLGLEVKE